MSRLKFILLYTAVSLFVACEYDPSGNNYIDLTPPEVNIPIQISLNNINPSDTILLYSNTTISINISSTKNLKQAVVLLDGNEYENMWGNSLSFVFYPDQVSEGLHKLTVGAVFASGTGSLAELMGMEGYTGELSWNFRVIHNPQDRFEVKSRIDQNGYLEVYWENVIPDSYIASYSISGLTFDSELVFTDAKQKSFIDSAYACGTGYYEVKTHLKDGRVFSQYHSFEYPVPDLYFEDLGLNKLRVYWDKTIVNSRFTLVCGNLLCASVVRDTSVIIPQLFGLTRRFTLYVGPENVDLENFHNKHSVWGNFCQGVSLELPNWPLYSYSTTDNIIYTTRYDQLIALDANTLQEVSSVLINGSSGGISFGGKTATAPHNSTIAAMTGRETLIYTDSRFANPIKISPLRGDVNTRLAALTSNDRFFVVEQDSSSCKVFNSLTGEKIFEIPFTYKTRYTFPSFVTVSENGQFFCASSENGIEVFEINGTVASLLYTDTREYKGAMFVPSQPNKLLLRVGSNMELRQIPDFSIVQTLDVSGKGAILCNIDPATQNLLYHQNDSLRVCSINNLSETIFKIRSNEATCKMFNNKLLTYGNGGATFDITPYISR